VYFLLFHLLLLAERSPNSVLLVRRHVTPFGPSHGLVSHQKGAGGGANAPARELTLTAAGDAGADRAGPAARRLLGCGVQRSDGTSTTVMGLWRATEDDGWRAANWAVFGREPRATDAVGLCRGQTRSLCLFPGNIRLVACMDCKNVCPRIIFMPANRPSQIGSKPSRSSATPRLSHHNEIARTKRAVFQISPMEFDIGSKLRSDRLPCRLGGATCAEGVETAAEASTRCQSRMISDPVDPKSESVSKSRR
jgi:hypothetical protein